MNTKAFSVLLLRIRAFVFFASIVVVSSAYTLVAADSGRIIAFEVAPAAATGASTGVAVASRGMVVNPDTAVLPLDFGIRQRQFSGPAVNSATHYPLMESSDRASGLARRGTDITTTSSTQDIAGYRQDQADARYLLQACNSHLCSSSSEPGTLGDILSAIEDVEASNIEADNRFGSSVTWSRDGNTLAVGVWREDSNATGISTDGTGEGNNSASDAGAVYVFGYSDDGWVQQAYVKASNAEAGDFFGASVALSSDGNTLVVGAPFEDSNARSSSTDGTGEADNSAPDAGAVYVFDRNDGYWSRQAYVKAPGTEVGGRFGMSVALSSDGNTLAVGARGEDSNATGVSTDGTGEGNNSASGAGVVYVFDRNDGYWSRQAVVKASNAEAGDYFGESVVLSSDGNTLAVGARGEASNATGISSDGTGEGNNSASGAGAVYVFGRNGGRWSRQAYVKASNAEVDDEFGISVALSSDGNTLAVGARGEDSSAIGVSTDGTGEENNSASGAGAVYVFGRNGGFWSRQAYVKASNTETDDGFSNSVALSSDGNTLVVGAPFEAGNVSGISIDGTGEGNNSAPGAGAVYVFGRNDGYWSQQVYVKATSASPFDFFGTSVSISRDGNILTTGAWGKASNAIDITHGMDE